MTSTGAHVSRFMPAKLPLLNDPSPSRPDLRFTRVRALVVKVTTRCNLDCAYCYELVGRTGQDMPIGTFKQLLNVALSNTKQSHLHVIFHGGEPTLLPDDWFDEAATHARTTAKQKGKSISLGLQTNLIGINDARLLRFRDLNIAFGVSLDGPSNLPNPMRQGGERALRHFLRARELGLRVGVLMTINHSNGGHFDRILQWLEQDAKVSDFKANVSASVGAGLGLAQMDTQHVFAAQKTIVDYMVATRAERVVEQNLAEDIVRFFEGKTHESLCNDRTCGAGASVLGVTPSGDLLPCGRFPWNDHGNSLGTLSDGESAAYDTFSSKVAAFHSKYPENWTQCADCSARTMCSYGCQAFVVNSRDHRNIECFPTKRRHDYFVEITSELHRIFPKLKSRLTPEHHSKRTSTMPRTGPRQNPFLRSIRRARQPGAADGYIDSYKDFYNDYTDNYHDAYSDSKGVTDERELLPGNARNILIKPGSDAGVQHHLELLDVPREEIEEILGLLKTEGLNSQTKRFNSNVNAWVQKKVGQSLDGTWDIEPGEAASFLTALFKAYYGT